MKHDTSLRTATATLFCALAFLGLSGCGGSVEDAATIGGTINSLPSGLSITLQNNGGSDFTIAGNGSPSFTFNFATGVDAGGSYSVTVLKQPLGQSCVVTNGTGKVSAAGDSVTSVVVNCSIGSSVVGTVSGLAAGVAVTLASNGKQLFLSNGDFSFPDVLTTGSTYTVTIAAQPAGQTCTLANATGTVVANKSAAVTVTCV